MFAGDTNTGSGHLGIGRDGVANLLNGDVQVKVDDSGEKGIVSKADIEEKVKAPEL